MPQPPKFPDHSLPPRHSPPPPHPRPPHRPRHPRPTRRPPNPPNWPPPSHRCSNHCQPRPRFSPAIAAHSPGRFQFVGPSPSFACSCNSSATRQAFASPAGHSWLSEFKQSMRNDSRQCKNYCQFSLTISIVNLK